MAEEHNEMREIVDSFVIEIGELLESIDRNLLDLESDPCNMEIINRLFRGVHTIKGAAGLFGFVKIVDVVHGTENILNKCRKGELRLTPAINEAILKSTVIIKIFLDNIADKEELTADISPLLLELRDCQQDETAEAREVEKEAMAKDNICLLPNSGELVVEEVKLTDEQLRAELGFEPKEPEAAKKAEAGLKVSSSLESPENYEESGVSSFANGEQTIRVDVERLDTVMNLVGELVLGRNQITQIGSELEKRYRSDNNVQNLAEAMARIKIITTDIQSAVMKTRMQPVKKVFSRFPRMVRDIGKLLGKEISLRFEGEETELDKSVIEEIGDPLVHLIRNAVDHGIEAPDVREAAGKPRAGEIVISAFHDGNSIVVEVGDDGGGIDVEAIAVKALEQGIIEKSELERLNERDKLNFLFTPGFSTAKVATDISGRGVGMDIVRNNVVKLNGTIAISTELGKGTVFSVKFPLTVAIIQTLRVGVGEESFALPLVSVVETARISADTIQHVETREVMQFRGDILPLVRLANLFDVEAGPEAPDALGKVWFYVVVIAIAEKKIALMVEKLFGQEEVVIKPLGEYIKPKGIAGATILGDGTVTLIVDLGAVIGMIEEDYYSFDKAYNAEHGLAGEKQNNLKKILIVDSSAPSRKIQKKILESGGFTVLEAVNGREGFEILNKHPEIDLIVTEIVMQGMDGIEMTKKIRSEPKLKAIPIIALTASKGQKNKNAGFKAGIDQFFHKTDTAGMIGSIRRHFN